MPEEIKAYRCAFCKRAIAMDYPYIEVIVARIKGHKRNVPEQELNKNDVAVCNNKCLIDLLTLAGHS